MSHSKMLDPKTFGYWGYLAVEKHFQKIIKHEIEVIKDKDPEELHQMRVGMRRLRTAVTSFEGAISLPKAAREKKIAIIARILGELRDLDVLKDTLKNRYFPALPTAEQNILKKVLATLKKRRHKSVEQVQATLKQPNYGSLKQALQNWLEQPTYGLLAQRAIEDILPDLLSPLLSKLLLHPAWLIGIKLEAGKVDVPIALNAEIVAHLLDAHGDSLHCLRKQAKGVRYQMELFTDFYDSTYKNYVRDIKAIQRVVGEIQDSFVLAAFLTDTLKFNLREQMPTLAAQLTATRYQSWQEWQILQQRYLNAQIRKDFHQILLTPVPLVVQGEMVSDELLKKEQLRVIS
ncbi:MAG: CHAD domain-containing protein [Symploca sp. SIO3E6]|nr:CHAD domain-containing protein [Caldora sp. SIO3E6]